MATERILITGIGAVSSIGTTRDRFWAGCLSGRSGAETLSSRWVVETDITTKFAAPVHRFDPAAAGIAAREVSLLDRTTCFALAAGHEAVVDAGLAPVGEDDTKGRFRIEGVAPERIATIVGTGIGGLTTFETMHATWRAQRSKVPCKRYGLVMLIPNAPAGQLGLRFGARGECKAITTACAAGTMAIGDAWRLLRAGEADVALAGGAEGVVGDEDAFALLGFDRLKTLSTRNDAPERASRPFDRDRDGFVLGEGACILVLEREEHAKARGARAYAAVAGYAAGSGAASMMQLDESGASIVSLGKRALAHAGRATGEVEHVSAHGTSTITNDRTEARGFRDLFGRGVERVSVTSLKSMTGHAIGASGALETAALAMGIRDGVLTPTINYEFPDPECDLDVVANAPRFRRTSLALKFSYGFGGHDACLVLEPA